MVSSTTVTIFAELCTYCTAVSLHLKIVKLSEPTEQDLRLTAADKTSMYPQVSPCLLFCFEVLWLSRKKSQKRYLLTQPQSPYLLAGVFKNLDKLN